jgi:hypothetical protein
MNNNAPKKIYLQVCGDCSQTDCENCKFEDMEDDITWCKDRIFPKDIEYTRTDAFIEKACGWLKESVTNNPECNRIISKKGVITMGELIEDFRKYMGK